MKATQDVGIPHDTLAEIVVSCVAVHDRAQVIEDELRSHARTRLASNKVPRRVLFFAPEDLAVTGSSKVKTGELRRVAAEQLAMQT